ncbi:hypothetical protein EPUS_06122 [Endocarpon pusillum Z07020]|uniref:SNF7 family protein n=1 Tax=Endocarpon pusillum (strain Z07020 / HMAS-L-300199) TaxID=1263415 RepID=U1GWJ3_ENDPU|nr:uncharacterized protein EPUS_06122 [Endocarpon pusillum Z07020]ERF76461.1 hypothetical protein EPUS_06122 [Endocarpon pusillum Z07020]
MPELLDWILQNEESFRKSRLPSLYSDLSLQRQTNLDGYNANIHAWQTALSHAALAGHLPSSASSPSILTLQTSEQLLSALSSRQYGRPLGLGAVIDESVRSGKMIPRSDFLGSKKSIYARSWVPSPWSLLSWGLKTIGLLGEESWDVHGRLRVGELVVVENVERLGGEVLSRQESRAQGVTDRVVSREAFAKELASGIGGTEGVGLSEKDVEILLKFLEREKQAISYNEKVVKFKQPSAARPEPITQQDVTIASLKTLISTLTLQCENLSARISSLTITAFVAVKSSNRISALSALRSKKLAERNLKQRSDTLSQLEEVYTKIEQAADQVEIVRVMEASAGVLKGMNKQVGGVERVEDVIEELREEMGKVDEVGKVINEPMGAREQVDESEIDDELEAMEREEKEKEARRVKEKEEKEAEVTRSRLEEIARREDLEETEKRRKVEELEQGIKKSQESDSVPNEAVNQLDASTKRLSQMSHEDDAAGKTHDTDGMQGVQKAVAEGSS